MYKFSPAGVPPYVHDIILTLFHGTYATFKKRGHNMYSWVWALSSMSLWNHLWWCSLILWVSVVLLRTVVSISDWHFDNLGRSHHPSDNDCDQDPSSHHQSESSGGQNISYYQWQSFSLQATLTWMFILHFHMLPPGWTINWRTQLCYHLQES